MTTQTKIGIVACSNGQPSSFKRKAQTLNKVLELMNLEPVWSEHIYEKDSVFSGTAQERADSLMQLYKNDAITYIFDISGGDLANEILPYLDFDVIARSRKLFCGYSDLTTIINSIYTKTGNPSVLYQIRNLISDHSAEQISNFQNTITKGMPDLYQIQHTFIQKDSMEGIVIGGNLRCLLKLAGTEFWPDMTGKILLLEAYGGGVPQMTTYLNQLKQIGVFQKISGILLGTFTIMERDGQIPSVTELVKTYAGTDIPIACTPNIGHGSDSKAILIGKHMQFRS